MEIKHRESDDRAWQAGSDEHGRTSEARRRVRLPDRLGQAYRLKDVVRATSVRGGAQLLDRIAFGGIDGVSRADLQRGCALEVHRVDREDRRGAGDARPLDRRHADRTTTDHRDR